MQKVIALDFGTSNSSVATWDSHKGIADLLPIPGVTRGHSSFSDVQIDDGDTIPSAVFLEDEPSFFDRMTATLDRFKFIGNRARVGMAALNADAMQMQRRFHSGFKRDLLAACASGQAIGSPAYNISRQFLREVLAHTTKALGWRPRQLVFGTPVDCFEAYRGALEHMARSFNMKARFIDEPVAAALGYGSQLKQDNRVLVIDFGAGTLDLVAMMFGYGAATKGSATVLGKWGERLGGNDVDHWVAEYVCDRLGLPSINQDADPLTNWWLRLVLAECRSMKEQLFFKEKVPFSLEIPPSLVQRTAHTAPRDLFVSRDDLIAIMAANKFYQRTERAIDHVVSQAGEEPFDQVLMVGGSTLLPEVYRRVEQRFGRARIKAWQPFHAVTLGAAIYAAGELPTQDHIFHDYAIRAWDRKTHQPQHQLIIKRGTKFPTTSNHWIGRFVPTCAHGEPEETFKLIICEIGRKIGAQNEVAWTEQGAAVMLKNESDSVLVALNEQNPVLGTLDPPHWPSEKKPRLEIQFGIDENRWLIATVRDLKRNILLMDHQPVLQLQ
ncbi:MAG: Hsp70 family protein [Acidobacteria bacterium]|nr:Hsp70 family protein [Acidobacteriota bacterium]